MSNRRKNAQTRYKGSLVDFAQLMAHDDSKEFCVPLTARQRAAILAHIEPVAWYTRYVNIDDTPHNRKTLRELRAAINNNLFRSCGGIGDEMAFRLRQNPNNPCLLEQSFDNGITWLPAFDYALCTNESSNTYRSIVQANLTAIEDSYNTYKTEYTNNGITGVVTNISTSWQATDDDNNKYQCAIFSQYLNSLFDLLYQLRQDDLANDQQDIDVEFWTFIASLVTAAIGGLTGGIAGAVAGWALAQDLGRDIITEISDLNNQYDLEKINDQSIRDEIICCALQSLPDDGVITQANFAASTQSGSCAGMSTDANNLMPALHVLMQQTDTYLGFLIALNEADGKFGDIDLPCLNCGIDWQDEIAGGDWTKSYAVVEYGTYNPGTGNIEGVVVSSTDKATVKIVIPDAPQYIEKIVLTYRQSICSGCNGRTSYLRVPENGSILSTSWNDPFPAPANDREFIIRSDVNEIWININASDTASIRKLVLYGKNDTGVSPFEGVT